MMISQSSATTTASADAVWALWSSPQRWPDWDPDVASVDFEGDFVEGAKGTLTPTKGPKSRWCLHTVVPGRRFVTTTRLPGSTVTFDHTISHAESSPVITHLITMTGWTSPILGRILGPRLAPHLSEAVASVAAHAEKLHAN